jgi:hypothetical protein
MAEQRRQFSPQFRAEAVQLVTESGKPIAQVARDLGIHDGTLVELGQRVAAGTSRPGDEVQPGRAGSGAGDGGGDSSVRMENEFLKSVHDRGFAVTGAV